MDYASNGELFNHIIKNTKLKEEEASVFYS